MARAHVAKLPGRAARRHGADGVTRTGAHGRGLAVLAVLAALALGVGMGLGAALVGHGASVVTRTPFAPVPSVEGNRT